MTNSNPLSALCSTAIHATTVELVRWRSTDTLVALHALAEYVKEDGTFKPTRSGLTLRLHVTAAGSDWELLANGSKFYDTRSLIGGGGAIDLAMHLWKISFKSAVTMLRRAGL